MVLTTFFATRTTSKAFHRFSLSKLLREQRRLRRVWYNIHNLLVNESSATSFKKLSSHLSCLQKGMCQLGRVVRIGPDLMLLKHKLQQPVLKIPSSPTIVYMLYIEVPPIGEGLKALYPMYPSIPFITEIHGIDKVIDSRNVYLFIYLKLTKIQLIVSCYFIPSTLIVWTLKW